MSAFVDRYHDAYHEGWGAIPDLVNCIHCQDAYVQWAIDAEHAKAVMFHDRLEDLEV